MIKNFFNYLFLKLEITRCQFNSALYHCPKSGIQAWAFNQSIGDCYYFEMCDMVNHYDEMNNHLNKHKWHFRRRRTSQWLGVWQAQTENMPDGIYATRSACQYHCLPKPPKGIDAQSI